MEGRDIPLPAVLYGNNSKVWVVASHRSGCVDRNTGMCPDDSVGLVPEWNSGFVSSFLSSNPQRHAKLNRQLPVLV